METQSKESWQETRAAHIATQVIEDLTSGSGQTGFFVKDGKPSENDVEKIDMGSQGTYEAAYDQDGNPVSAGSGEVRFHAKLTVEPDTARSGLNGVTVQVLPTNASEDALGYRFFTKAAASKIMNPATP